MKKVIVAVGSLKNRPEKNLFDTFNQRLNPPPILHEIPTKVNSTFTQEAESILAYLKPDDYIIALDEGGNTLSTRQFADLLNQLEKSVRRCVFVIGGADGLDTSVKQRAQFCLSLGRMTWSHLLARSLLIEQLYRCQQIACGHPYHRD